MNSRFYQTTVRPDFTSSAMGTAYSDDDCLFTWNKFHIPKGTAKLTNISGIIQGTNGTAGNSHDFTLFFARTINGVAPTRFDIIHTGMTATFSASYRRHMIGKILIDESHTTDTDHLTGYSVFNTGDLGGGGTGPSIILNSDGVPFNNSFTHPSEYPYDGGGTTPSYMSETPEGYETYFVAAIAHGAFDFGTDVDLNQVGNQAASTDTVTITVSGTNAQTVFAAGDILVGETGGPTMEVVKINGSTSMDVKNISEQIDHQEQLCFKSPIRLELGFEY
tara:strand:- start:6 stop:836 length:831 start_codon:yes stop_codon:yes gene_type:complete